MMNIMHYYKENFLGVRYVCIGIRKISICSRCICNISTVSMKSFWSSKHLSYVITHLFFHEIT